MRVVEEIMFGPAGVLSRVIPRGSKMPLLRYLKKISLLFFRILTSDLGKLGWEITILKVSARSGYSLGSFERVKVGNFSLFLGLFFAYFPRVKFNFINSKIHVRVIFEAYHVVKTKMRCASNCHHILRGFRRVLCDEIVKKSKNIFFLFSVFYVDIRVPHVKISRYVNFHDFWVM